MIAAVLDTNVLVSGFPARRGVPAALIGSWRAGAYRLVVSEHILGELAETWRDHYWAARFSPAEVADALALLRTEATVTAITARVAGVATHPEDDLVLSTAASAAADYLGTRDRQLLKLGTFQGVRIVHPADLADLLHEGGEEP